MDVVLRLLVVAALILANAFFVTAEFALVAVRRTRVEQLAASGSPLARLLQRAQQDPNRFIAAAQLGITMASLALGWVGELTVVELVLPLLHVVPAPLEEATAHSVAIVVSFAFITFLHITLGEQVPKMLALTHSERAALITVAPTEAFYYVFRPFIWLLAGTTNQVLRLLGVREPPKEAATITSDELELIVQKQSALEPSERTLLANVFDFADLAAYQVMVPRRDVVGIPVNATFEEAMAIAERVPHARFPVYEGSLDNIVGVVHIRDLFTASRRGPAGFDLRKIMRQPLFVPDTISVADLLTEFKRRRMPYAVAIDEYGGTAGVVTLDDLIEEIVGETADEFEQPSEEEVRPQPDGTFLVNPRLRIDEANERFGLQLESEEADTLGGLVLDQLGRMAAPGDEVTVDGATLRVEAVQGVRITCLRLIPQAQGPAEPPE